MSQIFLGRHVEARFELSKEAAEGEIGLFREFSDGDVVPIVFVKKLKSGPKFFVFAQRGGALVEGAGDANDATDFVIGVAERFFCRCGPIDKATTARYKFDTIDDGLTRFQNSEVILANVFEDVLRNEIIIAFAENVSGLENFTELFVECNVAELAVFDEVDEAGEVVEDGGEMILNAIFPEELVVLHRDGFFGVSERMPLRLLFLRSPGTSKFFN